MLRAVKKLFKSNYLFTLGVIICLAWILAAVFAPLIAPYDPIANDLTARLQAPSAELPAEAVRHAASVAGTFQLQQAIRRAVFIEATEGRGIGFRCGEPVVKLAVLCVRQGFAQQTGGEQTGIFLRCFHVSGQFGCEELSLSRLPS